MGSEEFSSASITPWLHLPSLVWNWEQQTGLGSAEPACCEPGAGEGVHLSEVQSGDGVPLSKVKQGMVFFSQSCKQGMVCPSQRCKQPNQGMVTPLAPSWHHPSASTAILSIQSSHLCISVCPWRALRRNHTLLFHLPSSLCHLDRACPQLSLPSRPNKPSSLLLPFCRASLRCLTRREFILLHSEGCLQFIKYIRGVNDFLKKDPNCLMFFQLISCCYLPKSGGQ